MKRKTKRIFSLLLALAVMATMLTALPLTASAAEEGYVEYVFNQTYNKTISSDTPDAASTYTSGLAAAPVLTTSNTGKTYSSTSVTSYSQTLPYSGKSVTWSGASKGSNGNGFIFNSKLSENTAYAKYNVTVIYTSHSSTQNTGVTLTDNDTSAVIGSDVYEVNSALTPKSVTFYDIEAENLKIIFGGETQPRVYYIGIEYIPAEISNDKYAEWIFGNAGNNNFNMQEEPNSPVQNPIITYKNNLTSEPSMTITRHELNKNYACQGIEPSYTGTTSYKKKSLTWTHACKVSNNHGFYIDTNMAENGATSYDVTVAWRGNSSDSTIKFTDNDTNQVIDVGTVTATNTAITVKEFSGFTAENLKITFAGEAMNLYIGIKYNVEPSVTFGRTDTDKGFYYDADVSTKLGVIRFFQEVAASGVENYGFYILDSKGETEKAVITPEAEKVTELAGIYADLYGIPETDESKATNYYMKAFVTIGGETYVAPSAVYTTPNFEREVEYTVTETEEVTE